MPKAGPTLLVLTLAAALALPAVAPQGARAGPFPFEQRPITVPAQQLFDLGVVDFDGDDDLDVFTTNHNDRQGLLANQGNGEFEDRLSAVRLDQSPGFPGFEAPVEPAKPVNGVYLFRSSGGSLGDDVVEGSLVMVVEEDPGVEVSGTVEFALPVTVQQATGADVSTEVDVGQAPSSHVVHFTTHGDARIVLEPAQMAAPIEVGIEEGYPLSAIFVGPLRVSPHAHSFTLELRDRHGMAWGDYDRDGRMDVFIVRGGLKGHLQDLGFAGLIADELMLGDGSTFHDQIGSSGLKKGKCRGREAAPVDLNRDGLLDLFWSCHGSNPALYRQNRNGKFRDRSFRLTRARIEGEPLRWLDVNGDGDDELLATRKRKLVVYRRSSAGRWWRREVIRTLGKDAPGRVAVADYDDDGDPDLFGPSPTGNTLLVNRDGRYRARKPKKLGLPAFGSFTASWVDYDNDGDTDLHTVPGGIYRRTGRRDFEYTGLATAPLDTLDALTSWFDFNGDGARDLLLASANPLWESSVLENLDHRNHWLQLELTGRGGSYPAVGARVSVKSGGRRQTQWVGQNDGARYSQGHYRLYFGLGDAARARAVKVVWPDGSKRKLKQVPADRLLHVSFGGR